MDRRQKKTKTAIYNAFAKLLKEKNYNQISVQEIIDLADVGRTTFYTHFETKDFLLKNMCEELFGHIISAAINFKENNNCEFYSDSVFLHLLRHLMQNDMGILELLNCENNEIFLRYFKSNLNTLIIKQFNQDLFNKASLPKDYLINHIASSFVETVCFWLKNGKKQTPEVITDYFLKTINPLITK